MGFVTLDVLKEFLVLILFYFKKFAFRLYVVFGGLDGWCHWGVCVVVGRSK